MQTQNNVEDKIFVHGHRGWRGAYPENTEVGFIAAFNSGVDALELDVVLTADREVLISHDPFMHHEICSYPDLSRINEEDEKSLNIFQMTLDSVKKYKCGIFPHPRFPKQQNIQTEKPALKATVEVIRKLALESGKTEPLWNIEIKSEPHWDNLYHPEPLEYAAAFIKCYNKLGIENNSVIQSFDPRILNELHHLNPQLKLILLSDDAELTSEDKLAQLNFVPYGYSPNFKLIDEDCLEYCKKKNMILVAWTVNEEVDIRRMIQLGVKHIISDYPDLVMKIRAEQN